MYIQRLPRATPYAAYLDLLELRGQVGKRGMALPSPELRMDQLTAPALKAHMLAYAERYELLGGMLASVLPTLSELADPGKAPRVQRVARIEATPTASQPGQLVYQEVAEPITRVVSMTGQAVQGLNQYLDTLETEGGHLPRGVQAFHGELTRTLQQEQETLSGLGLQVKGDRLALDEGVLDQALRRDALGVVKYFQRLNQAVAQSIAAQAVALNQMRSAVQATSQTASTISQVSASLFKMQHRAEKIGRILDAMKQIQDRMRDQKERMDTASDAPDAGKDDTASAPHAPSSQETDREPSGFGLIRSPVPESFLRRQDPTPGSSPRWPHER